MTVTMQTSLLTPPQKNSNARVKIFYSMARTFYADTAPKIDFFKRHLSEYTPQVQKDITIIAESYSKFIDLVLLLRESIEVGGMSDTQWSTYRHDLRGLLATVKGFSELILEEATNINTTLKSHLTQIIQSADNIILVIGEMGPTSALYVSDGEREENFEIALNNTLSGNILIVDDDDKKIETIARRLKQKGYSYFTANSGLEAFELLKSKKIDLLLLDILMPEMSGHDVLTRLKKARETQDIPVLIISSVSDLESVTACIRDGADDYLQFPFNLDLFYARINACLDKKRLKDLEKTHYDQIALERQRLKTAIESIEHGFALFDNGDVLIESNQQFKKLFPIIEQDISEPMTFCDLITHNLNNGFFKEDRRQGAATNSIDSEHTNSLLTFMMERHENPVGPFELHLRSGQWIEVIESKIPTGGTVSLYKNISDRKNKEERTQYLLDHDGLTGLLNRTAFSKAVNQLIESDMDQSKRFTILYFDLDGFKEVNDTFGHEKGDQILVDFSEQLLETTREEDSVARLGGDEFAVLLPDIDHHAVIMMVVNRILKLMNNEVEYNNVKIPFGVSIGVSSYPHDAKTLDSLLKKADQAMYRAKREGKGNARFANEVSMTYKTKC